MNCFNQTCYQTAFYHSGALNFSLKAISPTDNIDFIHHWVTQDYASFWGMGEQSLSEVSSFYHRFFDRVDANAYLGYLDNRPMFLLEVYNPATDSIAKSYQVKQGDVGMHILLSPPEIKIDGFSLQVMQFVISFLFAEPEVKRIVVEPDFRNHKIHRLNRLVGFKHTKKVVINKKTALLGFLDEQNFLQSLPKTPASPNLKSYNKQLPSEYLQLRPWSKVNRQLIAKMLSEFKHERLIGFDLMETSSDNNYRLTINSKIHYQFIANSFMLEHWLVDSDSILKFESGVPAAADAVQLIIELNSILRIPDKFLPTYLEEIASTLYSSSYKELNHRTPVSTLVDEDFQTIESAMTEGHPSFVANNGRIGFSMNDYLDFSPEVGNPIELYWLAADRERANFSSSSTTNYQEFIDNEFDLSTIEFFHQKLAENNLAPENYYFIPVHPWQWKNKIVQIYAGDLATNKLVFLGSCGEKYQAQQSIRTFYNLTDRNKSYVKTALSILNMGFVRGLSADYMQVTPAINDWVYDLINRDCIFKDHGFQVLREYASVGYRKTNFQSENLNKSVYNKMLACLWRENPAIDLAKNQKLITMASLLHLDNSGSSFAAELITRSGLPATEWIAEYLNSYFYPLLHCFYHYDLVFMPHGENLILKVESYRVVGVYMKDIGEEVCLLNSSQELPEEVERIKVDMADDIAILSIFTDVFDGFFRYLSAILVKAGHLSEFDFWKQVAETVHQFKQNNPQLKEKFDRYDLFCNQFKHSCLNRLQLANNRQMVDLLDPVKALQFVGNLVNPIAQFNDYENNKTVAMGSSKQDLLSLECEI